MNTRWYSSVLIMLVILLASCGGVPGGGSSVWIDVPLDGTSFSGIEQINIEGHVASPAGVSKVEIWVNGTLMTTINDPPMDGSLGKFQTPWMPPTTGEYTIQALAYSADGMASEPDSARVSFGVPIETQVSSTQVATITPMITVSPEVTMTYTPTLPPKEIVQFWADPATIEAGACTLIQWHAENVKKVIFGGIDQPFDGSYKDCLCVNQRYTLTVVKQDGSEQKYPVDISVNGTCVTPTPVDSTPPAVPSLVVPANGLTIACKASQTLAWLPVDDPSGIAKYGVQVQRHAGDNNWQPAPSGDQVTTDKNITIPVECGWYYRWRVIAVDGAGNESGWSGWSQFIISLG